MVKWKFFSSLYEEREWLESMAKQGWLLKDMHLGCRYVFTECEPGDKVYEIENFALSFSKNAKKQEIEAQKTAMDLIEQTGWTLVARDEAMNSYFVKERAGDETDELYDDEESRKQRAEKYRKMYCIEQPKELIKVELLLTIPVFLIYLILRGTVSEHFFMMVYFIYMLLALRVSWYTIVGGEAIYRELCMSREEWKERKKNSMKYSFRKPQDLLDYLQQRDEAGLKLVECEGNTYVFQPSRERYQYYLDTKQALKLRMKKQGLKYQSDRKDIEQVGTGWHEQSMEEAKKLGLETVCTVKSGTLVYRCPRENAVQWNSDVKALTSPWDGWKPYLEIGFVGGIILAIVTFVLEKL